MPLAEKITIYTNGFCPFTLHVRLAAAYKKIEYNLEQVSFSPKPEWFLKASPEGTVPIVKVGNSKSYFTEAADIIDYLEQKYPTPSIYPNNVSQEEVQQWVAFVRTEFMPAFKAVLMASGLPIQAKFRPKLKGAYAKFQIHLAARSNGPYFFGIEYSIVDILLTPFAARRSLHKFFREFDGIDPKAAELNEYLETIVNKQEHTKIAYSLDKLKNVLRTKIPWLPPMSMGMLEHASQRAHMKSMLEEITLALAVADRYPVSAIAHLEVLKEEFTYFIAMVEYHSEFEDTHVYARLLQDHPGSKGVAGSMHQHEHEISHLGDIPALIEATAKDITKEKLKAMQKVIAKQFAGLEDHLVFEQDHVFPLVQLLPKAENALLFVKIYADHKDFYDTHLPFMLEGMTPAQRAQYVANFAEVLQKTQVDEWVRIANTVYRGLDDEGWNDLKYRVIALSNVEVSKNTPVENTPVESAPVESAPVESAPVESAPVESAPVESAPVESAPVESAPVERAPVERAPVERAHVKSAPVESAPVESAPVESAPVKSVSFNKHKEIEEMTMAEKDEKSLMKLKDFLDKLRRSRPNKTAADYSFSS